MHAPTVTVGLPVFNGEDFLAQAVESILGQTHGDLELILSDNGSDDGTEDICRKYAAEDERVRYLRHDVNRGASFNWNCTVHEARAPLFRWANHDDWLAPECIAACVAALDSADDDVVMASTRSHVVDDAGEMEPYHDAMDLDLPSVVDRFRELILKVHLANAVFGLVRTDVLRDTRMLGAYFFADAVVLGEVVLRGRIVEVPEPLFYRRMHSGRSLVVNPTPADILRFYDTAARGRHSFPTWRLYRGYADAIRRAPLSPSERLGCLKELGRHPHRKRLYKEPWAALAERFGGRRD